MLSWNCHQTAAGSYICRRCAPFTYDAWNHSETLAIVSKIAGVHLIPAMNLEIAHVNVSVKSVQAARDELESVQPGLESSSERPSKARRVEGDEKPVVGWHTDSYPFVCVTMLSDCTNMIGGETALRTANNEVLKVRGPEKVRRPQRHLSHFLTGLYRAVPSSCKAATSHTKHCMLSVPKNVSPW